MSAQSTRMGRNPFEKKTYVPAPAPTPSIPKKSASNRISRKPVKRAPIFTLGYALEFPLHLIHMGCRLGMKSILVVKYFVTE